MARLTGERAQYIAARAQAKGKITETELQIIQVDKDVVSEVSKDLRETNDKIGEFVERKVTAEDQLRRIDIRAPQDGIVLQSTVHTVGGVITAGDAIMMIVPRADDLSVEAKVNPQDIDKLQIGQKTLLRLSAFNQRTTPELNGVVTRVSADVTTDQRTGQSYYTIRVSLPPQRGRAPRRGQDHPGHAGGSLRPDRRPHHVLLSDEAVQRPADALVPGAVSGVQLRWPLGPGSASRHYCAAPRPGHEDCCSQQMSPFPGRGAARSGALQSRGPFAGSAPATAGHTHPVPSPRPIPRGRARRCGWSPPGCG